MHMKLYRAVFFFRSAVLYALSRQFVQVVAQLSTRTLLRMHLELSELIYIKQTDIRKNCRRGRKMVDKFTSKISKFSPPLYSFR